MHDGKISTDGELVVKAQYTNFMQDNTKLYWEQKPQQNNIIVPTRTSVHPCLDVTTVTTLKNTKNICNEINHAGLYKGFLYV